MKATIEIALILIFCSGYIFGQVSSHLEIMVTDQSGSTVTDFSCELSKLDSVSITRLKTSNGKVRFSDLDAGEYVLSVESMGFENYSHNLLIKRGANQITIRLDLKKIEEKVDVFENRQEAEYEAAFGGFMTQEQISRLPSEGKEIERELRRIYGEDIIIKVDGFSDGVPDKSKILSIRAVQSAFDAENHEIGYSYVYIQTKVTDQSFTGSIGVDFFDSSLNARNPISIYKLPEREIGYDLNLMGPIKRNRADFSIAFLSSRKISSQDIRAFLPSGEARLEQTKETLFRHFRFDSLVNLPKNHVGKFIYLKGTDRTKGNIEGELNLPERAFQTRWLSDSFRFSESGIVGKKFFNEILFSIDQVSREITPASEKPTVFVIGAFVSGGAGNRARFRHSKLSLKDNFLFSIGGHSFKAGGQLEFESLKDDSWANINGKYTFSDIEAYQRSLPTTYSQALSPRNHRDSNFQLSTYIQSDFRVRKSLGLSAGIRYETQSILRDRNNISPRASFVFSPLSNGGLTIRGGAGIYYVWHNIMNYSFVNARGRDTRSDIILQNPSFPADISNLQEETENLEYWIQDEKLINPYVIYTSLASNWQIDKRQKLRVEYTFQKTLHNFRTRDINVSIDGVQLNRGYRNINLFE